MNYAVIACETLQDELNLAIKETGCNLPVVWVNSDYHDDSNKLRTKLQEEIDKLTDIDYVLFAYGCCGNALVGLNANKSKLIIPVTDDCISMVLSEPGKKYIRHKETYFLTRGWLESSKSIAREHAYTIKRYGETRAKKIFSRMFEHYRYLMLIDTGAYNFKDNSFKFKEFAKDLGLEPVVERGNIWFLKKLLLGPYDEDFCIIEKGESVTLNHFGYVQRGPAHQHQ